MESTRMKNSVPRQRLWLLISLMAVSTILFVIGISLERGGEAREAAETPSSETGSQPHIVATMAGGESSENGQNTENNESGSAHTEGATALPTPHVESGESGSEQNEGATAVATPHLESNEASGVHTETATGNTQAETIMGINIENPAFVIAAVIVWLALIVLVVLFGRVVLVPIILVALGTTLFDLAEIAFQLSRSNSGLTILAALVAFAHVAVAVVAGMILLQRVATPAAQAKG